VKLATYLVRRNSKEELEQSPLAKRRSKEVPSLEAHVPRSRALSSIREREGSEDAADDAACASCTSAASAPLSSEMLNLPEFFRKVPQRTDSKQTLSTACPEESDFDGWTLGGEDSDGWTPTVEATSLDEDEATLVDSAVAQLCERELRCVRDRRAEGKPTSPGESMVKRRQPTGRRPIQRSLTKSKTLPPMSQTKDEDTSVPRFAPVQEQLDHLKGLAADPARLAEALPSLLATVQELLVLSIPSPKRYNPETADVTGFLVDLDGTVYRPDGLIRGAKEFHEWLVQSGKPFVYLSNTGAKSSDVVRKKLATAPFRLTDDELPEGTVYTAAEAQVEFMAENIPAGAKVFVLSGGGSFWMEHLRRRCPELLDTWEVRTTLSDAEAKEWAVLAAADPAQKRVWVVLFVDGPLTNCTDPTTGAVSPADWSFDLIRCCSYVLAHGAHLVYTAEDASNPAIDSAYNGYVWPQPGPGMFASMLKTILPPQAKHRVHCLGKGGNDGSTYMMSHAIELLQAQGHDGDRSKILIVGDRFDTDIRGGRSAGVRTCLVGSGAHKHEQQKLYPHDVADFIADRLAAMLPVSKSRGI
jgi:ribonucleotide monophosphatase NagD (HAD superfamily)